MFAATVIYDITRDGIGLVPVVALLAWIGGAVAVVCASVHERRNRRPVVLLAVWLTGWLTLGGIAVGGVFRAHFRYRAWAASGSFEVVEGRVTEYHPQDRSKKGDREVLSVAGHTWTYSNAVLAPGYRGSPSAKHLVSVGSVVRISSRDGQILKLEVLDK